MKLYATVTSERESRPARKGGDEYIEIVISCGNDEKRTIRMSNYQRFGHRPNQIKIEVDGRDIDTCQTCEMYFCECE
jgi:hypothetical protein